MCLHQHGLSRATTTGFQVISESSETGKPSGESVGTVSSLKKSALFVPGLLVNKVWKETIILLPCLKLQGKKKNSYPNSLRAPRLVTATRLVTTTGGRSWKHFQVREVRDFQNFPVYSGLGKVRMQNSNTVLKWGSRWSLSSLFSFHLFHCNYAEHTMFQTKSLGDVTTRPHN